MDANPTPPVAITPEAPQSSTRVPLSERLALSPAEVARALGMGRTACYAAIASGQIPSQKIGGLIRVPTAALKAMLEGELEAVRLVRRVG